MTVVAIEQASYPVTAAGPQRIFTVFPILRGSDMLTQHPSPLASLSDRDYLSTPSQAGNTLRQARCYVKLREWRDARPSTGRFK